APPAPVIAPPAPVAPRVPVRTEPKIDFQNACDRPEYTAAARRAETSGSTTVLYTMDTTGQIAEATVEKSSGPTREHKVLDRLALEAVRACKGTPGTLDGKPEKLTSRITYVWRITD
ncbi:MAG: energy transducer TonB, partial [Rubrivivax sp.]|nr:energy transducer TonB [Rubrivivax sp.]